MRGRGTGVAAVLLAAVLLSGCAVHRSSSKGPSPATQPDAGSAVTSLPSVKRTVTPRVAEANCSARNGRLIVSHAPFVLQGRSVQPFAYLNGGPSCYWRGFPTIRLESAKKRSIPLRYVYGHTVIGSANGDVGITVGHNDQTVGMNIESLRSGTCAMARYVVASFGGSNTPPTRIALRVCERVYVTTLFR